MRLYLAPDSDLRAFAVAPSALKAWLRFHRSLPDVSLHEYWRDLDTMLMATPSASARSLLTANGADWIFPDAGDLGAYGLSSTSMQALQRAVLQVDPPAVEAYVRKRADQQARATGATPGLTPVQLASSSAELGLYLTRLREACALGTAKGYGAVMALWEEP
ncbi:MAG: hypothetical protein ABI742_13470 [Gemmatimonadota bacterium]